MNESVYRMLNNTSHSYIVYGPLIHGCTSVLYEGKPIKTPDVSFLSLSLISPLSSLSLTHAGGSILETYISAQSKRGICGTNFIESHKARRLHRTTREEIWYHHILVYRIGLTHISPCLDLSAFRTLFVAGERADPQTVKFGEDILHRPIIDHWWQTETG